MTRMKRATCDRRTALAAVTACAFLAQSSGIAADAPVSSTPNDATLQEVVVTAEKRTERLQDTPVPVTAISSEALVDRNQLRLEDYYTEVPGLVVGPSTFGTPQVSIRGLTTGGATNPTVAITIDDVAYGSSSGIASGQEAPNIDPSDLQRVEVLRGPQGTLYGASSLGGLIKYVTIDPSTQAVAAKVQVGTSTVYNARELGYNVRGSVNVPVTDTFAVRASAFVREDPGYIDNVLTGQRSINETRVEGGLLAGLWRPWDGLSLKVSALIQHTESKGISEVYQGLGDLQQAAIYGTGIGSHDSQIFNATLNVNLGFGDLTSITGYSIHRFHEANDYTSIFGTSSEEQFGVEGTPNISHATTDKFTQEVRLAVPFGQHVDTVFGGFFDHESSPAFDDILAAVPETGQVVGQWVRFNYPTTFAEYAAFADITFHITDRFDLQLGGRESHNRQSYSETDVGQYYVPAFENSTSPFIYPEIHTSDNSFTYLVTPRFEFSKDLMIYARLASGYRPGGPNISSGFAIPPTYRPDTTRNYEVGAKTEMLDRKLTLDGSVYYINWRDIQVQLINQLNGVYYYSNGSEAKSQGVELSAEARPLPGLTVGGWFAWNDAKLTQDLPPTSAVIGLSGDRLPYSARRSGNFSVDQSFAVNRDTSIFLGATLSYVGDRLGQFAYTPERVDLPSYTKLDFRAGLRYQTWKIDLYATNVANRRGVLDGGGDLIPTNAFVYIQPRTVGLTLTKSL